MVKRTNKPCLHRSVFERGVGYWGVIDELGSNASVRSVRHWLCGMWCGGWGPAFGFPNVLFFLRRDLLLLALALALAC